MDSDNESYHRGRLKKETRRDNQRSMIPILIEDEVSLKLFKPIFL